MHWDSLSKSEQANLKIEEEDKEIRSLDDGIRRFRDQCANQPVSRWPAARALLATAAEALTVAIEGRREGVAEGRGFRGAASWGPVFLYMEPNVLAVSALCAAFDAFSSDSEAVSTTQLRNLIGTRVEMEMQFTELRREAPRLLAVMQRRVKKWDRRTIRKARQQVTDCMQPWDHKQRQLVGQELADLMLQHCGVVERQDRRIGRRLTRVVAFTEEARDVLTTMNAHLELLSPMYKPMLCPPNDWEPGERGGYILLSRYHQLVKGHPEYPDAMPDDHGPMVYDGVNTLQRTPWRVNEQVLACMQRVWQLGGGMAGVPEAEDIVVPERFEDEGDDTEWRVVAERYHRYNARLVGKRLSFLQTMSIAKEYGVDTFYFPYQCDFRGRIYPIPQFLQPQGNDVARALLTFADPKPLGESGLYWLRVQYANCWGVDKVSFGERVDWANEMLHDLIEQYPDACEFDWPEWMDMKHLWADADDPWQALATLIEIANAYSYGVPHEYPCSLPVNVDGSNSGLQHFSAMLRDPEGARLVNLAPSDKPSDIYTNVAKVVERRVREDQVSPDEVVVTNATGWLKAGINRKLCKRGTMTYCYGVTQQGLKDALREDGFLDWASNQFSAGQYIGKHIWAGILECITGATEAMDWLRRCATCANKAGVLLNWHTPSGFHVAHPYNEPQSVRVQCLSGEVHFRVFDPDADVSPHKQRNALPPNFVHSLDASHLLMTVSAGEAAGITHWMMIHDSFGTHAGQVDLLRDVLREQFVKLYEIDVLTHLREQVIEQTGEDPGPPPERGDFDLGSVHESTYIFS
jgi:DNA-directed RNA polymerase